MSEDEAPSALDRVESDTPALFDMEETGVAAFRALADDYIVPPFTVLDTKQGYWRDRVARWKGLGMKSEVGRESGLTYGAFSSGNYNSMPDQWEEGSTSIFDPLLTELMYRWFCPAGGTILDPFAGGSVRGIVASVLGHDYHGVELRAEQVESNRAQAEDIVGNEQDCPKPAWIEGDSAMILPSLGLGEYDMVFTCPPYADLEVYSDLPADISNMDAASFSKAYREILGHSLDRLANNRFAVIVIGRLRDKTTGRMRDLVGETITAMEHGGAMFYDEAILLNAVGTAAVRARKQMETSRKLVKIHQHALVFVKGDPRKATEAMAGASA